MQGVTELVELERCKDAWLHELQEEIRYGRLSEDNWNFSTVARHMYLGVGRAAERNVARMLAKLWLSSGQRLAPRVTSA
jgi:hypothetical protein